MMKIVHVLPALTKGGGERVAAELANHAARAGHEVTIIAAWPADPAELRSALRSDVRVRFIADAPLSRLTRYSYVLPWILRHRAWLSDQDILHCHMTFGVVFGAAVRSLRLRSGSRWPTVVETQHAVGMPMPPLNRWLRARIAARLDAFALMARDDYWCGFLDAHPDLLSQVILNGISDPGPLERDPEARIALRRGLGIPDDCRFVVGTIGMLRPDRVPWRYLPIFAEMARALGSQVHFVLAGGGAEHDRLRSLISEHGLEGQVHLPGLVLEPRLPLSVMDLYLTMNVRDVTGVAALEAAHLGVPVLAIQMAADYLAQPDDWIWSSTDPNEIAERAIALLRSPADRQELAARQSAHVRAHHTSEAMARSYEVLYRAAIERRKRAHSSSSEP